MAKDTVMGQMGQQKIGGKTLATRLEGIASFLKKHKVGVLIALGSLVILGAIVRKALDSSPMFQQMLKLWQFAITMIFRPLGDFFGFFFRPILILLLRKFIIPWYTTMYPVMIKLGHDLGSFVAGAMDWFLKIGSWFKGLFGDGDFDLGVFLTALFSGGIGYAKDIVNYFTTDFFPKAFKGVDLASTIVNFFTNSILPSAFGEDNKTISGLWDTFLSTVKSIFTEFPIWFPKIINSLKRYFPEMESLFSFFVSRVKPLMEKTFESIENEWLPTIRKAFSWINRLMDDAGDTIERALGKKGFLVKSMDLLEDDVYPAISKIAKLFTNSLTVVEGWWAKLMSNPIFRLVAKSAGIDELFANGGQINEPVLGIGRSGKSYMFGEAGSETVIPNSKLGGSFGGNITINIENMSGSQQDLNNLRQTILSVMQESRTRGGRI